MTAIKPSESAEARILRTEFRKLWVGQTISLLGSSVSDLAIPLVAVLTLGATATQMGVLQAIARTPYLLFALLIGAWVDRIRRRPVLVTTDLVRGAVTLLVPVAWYLHLLSMPALWVIGALIATANVFFELAYRAYLPNLVGRDKLVEANSRLQVTASTVSIVGPSLGGVLVQALSAPIAVIVDAVSFFASAVSLLLIRSPEPPIQRPGGRRLREEVWEGLSFLFKHRILRLFLLMTGTFNLFVMFSASVGVLFMVRELHLQPAQIGFVFAAASPGGLIGAALATRFYAAVGVGRTLVVSRIFMQLGLIATPLAFGPAIQAMAILAIGGALFGFGVTVGNIAQQSYRQILTPDRIQGRVQAANLTVVFGIAPIGSLIGGWLGSEIGLRPTLWAGVVGTTMPLLMLVLSPVLHVRQVEPSE